MTPRPADRDRALSGREFSTLMAAFAPFEPNPHIAVAVSGGADSLALAILTHRWARARGGTVTALTVDHGLRPESAAEAIQVGRMLRPLGMAHRVLRWRGDKPTSNVQATARGARYGLLSDWCARRGVLHLALAHQMEDQAETFLLRLGRGSGVDGLSAIPAVAEAPTHRILRPLLGVPRPRLEAVLRRHRLAWVDDPSNRDTAFARVRLRVLQPVLSQEGLSPRRLADTAGRLGRARAALAQTTAEVLARAAVVHPAGFVWLDPAPMSVCAPEVGLRALARAIMLVGGLTYPPRLERLERLYGGIVAGMTNGATLGGCRIVPGRGRHTGRILLARELAGLEDRVVRAGEALRWDRFDLRIRRGVGARRGRLIVGPLGSDGWAQVRAAMPRPDPHIPAPARVSVPALRDGRGLLAVPHLGFDHRKAGPLTMTIAGFSPRISLTAGSFTVA